MSLTTAPPRLPAPPRAAVAGGSLRIVLVSDGYLPRLGGIELHVRDLAARLAAAGHRVRVVTATGAGAATAGPGGVEVRRLQPRGAAGAVDPALWTGADRAGLLDALADADVVHAHSSVVSPLAWAAARAAHRRGVPAVLTVHSMLPRGSALPLAVALRGARDLRWTAVSEAVADPLRRTTGRPVAVLPNGVDAAPWRGLPRPGAAPRPFTVVSAGRFTARADDREGPGGGT
ncbi:glycosyltransferase, partial [Kineococcus sp. R8]|uniref:glycosyltransferase n=1 Tax=Kineococcus siccus TaxID=2696567 RepID=UPI00141221C9|nr:glycosyltransferase [Kineococcus siccus]